MSVINNTVSCAPYDNRAAGEIATGSLNHLLEFSVENGSTVWQLELAPGGANLTFDEDWAPYAQLQASFLLPDSTINPILDPRLKTMLRVKTGYKYGDGVEDLKDTAVLHLRSAVRKSPEMIMTMTGASSECLVQDQIFPGPGKLGIPTDSTVNALKWLIGRTQSPDPVVSTAGGSSVTLPDFGMEVGAELWSVGRDIAANAKVWFYHDGLGKWHIQPRPGIPSGVPYELATGANGTVIAYEIGQNRDDFADGVIIEHRYKANDPVIGVANVTNPSKWKLVKRSTPSNVNSAKQAAQTLLERYQAVRRSVEVTAKAAYWLRPGMAVNLKLPEFTATGRVSRVSFSYPAGRMNVRVVLPEMNDNE